MRTFILGNDTALIVTPVNAELFIVTFKDDWCNPERVHLFDNPCPKGHRCGEIHFKKYIKKGELESWINQLTKLVGDEPITLRVTGSIDTLKWYRGNCELTDQLDKYPDDWCHDNNDTCITIKTTVSDALHVLV